MRQALAAVSHFSKQVTWQYWAWLSAVIAVVKLFGLPISWWWVAAPIALLFVLVAIFGILCTLPPD